jgi:hypothetical protein
MPLTRVNAGHPAGSGGARPVPMRAQAKYKKH